MVAVHAQIAPVGGHDVLGKVWHFQRPEHPVHRIRRRAQEAAVLLLENLWVHLALGVGHVDAGGPGLLRQLEEVPHGPLAAGHQLLHLFDEVLLAAGQGGVQVTAVPGGGDDAEIVGHLEPAYVQPKVLLQHIADGRGVFLAAQLAHLMQGRLKLEPAAPEAGGHAAGQVVPLDEQRFFAGLRQSAGRAEAAVAGPDHDRVVLRHDDSSSHIHIFR